MQRTLSIIAAAALLSTGALAQQQAADKAESSDKTQVVPGKKDMKPQEPSARTLDDNTQRAHDRDRAAADSKPQGGDRAAAERQGASVAKSEKSDQTHVVPGKKDLKPQDPSVRTLDDNTQRAHDRDTAAGKSQASGERQAAAGGRQSQAVAKADVRDWDAIDTNNDNLIQPEEMEAALKEKGPQAPK